MRSVKMLKARCCLVVCAQDDDAIVAEELRMEAVAESHVTSYIEL